MDYDFCHFSSGGRSLSYRTITAKLADKDIVVKKKFLNTDQVNNYISQKHQTSRYYNGKLLVTLWIESLSKDKPFDELSSMLITYFNYVEKIFSQKRSSNDLVELIPSNIIVNEITSEWHIIDLEWSIYSKVTAEYVFFRAVFWFAVHNKEWIIRAGGDKFFENVEEFIIFCFKIINKDFTKIKGYCLSTENRFHEAVTRDFEEGFDVSFMLSSLIKKSNQTQINSTNKDFKIITEDSDNKINLSILIMIVKRLLKMSKSYFLDLGCLNIRRSGLFNSKYYLNRDEALRNIAIDPLYHYMKTGFKEGRDPGPFFSLKHYYDQYPELEKNGVEPISHYIKKGYNERASTHPLLADYIVKPSYFFGKPRLSRNKQQTKPLIDSSSFFNSDYYVSKYNDVENSHMLPIEHYLCHGGSERRQPGPLFDPEFYTDRTPHYNKEKGDLLDHFLKTGAKVGKSPIPVFDYTFYKASIDKQNIRNYEIFQHYLNYGSQNDLKPCEWFDPKYYRQSINSLLPYQEPLAHYLYEGVHQKVYVNRKIRDLVQKPLISVLVPVYNVKKEYLNCCIRSILFQSYPHWELCIVDDGSSEKHIKNQLDFWKKKDERIKVLFLDDNIGISGATNIAADMANGEYIAFVDNDDELHLEALYHYVKRINCTNADVIYCDENLIGDDGRQLSVFYKPDFNKELLYCHNYITHLVVIKKELFDSVNGLSTSLSGAQDYDLLLKITEKTENIEHIDKVLYHWRASEQSTSINHNQKLYANAAGLNALNQLTARQNISAEARYTDLKFYYRLKRSIHKRAKISLIILTSDDKGFHVWLEKIIDSCKHYMLDIVICGEKQLLENINNTIDQQDRYPNLVINTVPTFDIFTKSLNQAVKKCYGDYIVFIPSYVEIDSLYWIDALLEFAQLENIGFVEGNIILPDEISYTKPDISNLTPLYYSNFLKFCSRHLNGIQCAQYILMASYYFSMISKQKIEYIGGFDEKKCTRLFFDSDLSLRLRKGGFENVYTPHARGTLSYPFDIIFNKVSNKVGLEEKKVFQKKWEDLLTCGDPYYNYEIAKENGVFPKSFVNWYTGSDNALLSKP